MSPIKAWLHGVVFHRRWLTFLVMGAAFLIFGVTTLNLFYLFKANLQLYVEHGWMVVADGAAQQLVELILYGYGSLAFYLLFKACEYRLVHWLGDDDPPHQSLK